MNISLEPKMAYSIAYTNKTLKNHGREGTHLNNKTSFFGLWESYFHPLISTLDGILH